MKKKLLIFGGAGLIGSKFIEKNKDHFIIDDPEITELDILNKDALTEYFNKSNPDVVINYAAFTDVDRAEEEKGNKEGIVYRLNAYVVRDLCELCLKSNINYIHFSTDYVFDGKKSGGPYTEEDKPNPLSWYGETKLAAEEIVQESKVKGLIIRTSMPFSPFYELKQDIVRFFLKTLQENKEIVAVDDQIVTPAFVDDLSDALKLLIDARETGIYHVVCSSHTTPFDLARMVADKFGLNRELVSSTNIDDYNETRSAKRSKYGWLSVKKFEEKFGKDILHTVEESIDLFKKQVV